MAAKDTLMMDEMSIPPPSGDDVVISGVAGRFPSCRTVEELKQKLYDKQDLITTEEKWKTVSSEIPQRVGKVSDHSKFDAAFFGVHPKQVTAMDPMGRIILEHAYEAIVDAGLNPRQLRGRKIGVIVGVCYSESERIWFYEKVHTVDGFGIVGCSKAMIPNRISYFLGVHGPSYAVDTACSSSMLAMEHAYRLIDSGECEAVLVGGCNLCLHPYISLHFNRLGVLSQDGRCKCFDAAADGYARSETIAAVFVQRARDAKRIYATMMHAKTNCDGFKPAGITFPSSNLQKELLREFYEECKISPNILSYMEAHGTGTKVGDPEEIRAIDEVFCKNRKVPLKIGSVKSNLGHSEPASGLCSIIKVIIGMENGLIPPNINYHTPREDLAAIREGRMEVVTEPTPWDGKFAGVNSFGFGGANVHILLKGYNKKKINNGRPNDDLPRIVPVSGRTEESVVALMQKIEEVGLDVEFIRLFQDIHETNITGHVYKGYSIVGSKTSPVPIKHIGEGEYSNRPVWFVFSGMGSQWPGMGKELMRFPVFAKAIMKCDAVLRPRGLDIVNIITNPDKKMFDNILHSFVGIAAVQIGLVDLLTTVGIVPDNIIGHSVGELGCAYADGCFTPEQMVLAAHARGLASLETETIYGAMAATGLSYDDIKGMCPPEVDVACHNSYNSSTISGPAEVIRTFVKELQSKKIFAKEVACSNIAYHSRYIAEAGPKLLAYLKKVIPNPKPRSEKWICSSLPEEKWDSELGRFSSAEYHTNNLLSSVLFEEACKKIPSDAITIEIAPHGLLQAILKRALKPTVINVPLTKINHPDNVDFFLEALGKLYIGGIQMDLSKLYPPVAYPVSQGTPMISPSIKWDHSRDWFVPDIDADHQVNSCERECTITIADKAFQFMTGHVVDGRNLIPATGYLYLVWETYACIQGVRFAEKLPVVFEDIKFLRATTLTPRTTVKLMVMIHRGTGSFTITDNDAIVVTGVIRALSEAEIEKEMIPPSMLDNFEIEEPLDTNDIYKEFKLRGYGYWDAFRAMKSASIDGRAAHIEWTGNWVTFMDVMLQALLLTFEDRSCFVPTRIQKMVINPMKLLKKAEALPVDKRYLSTRIYKDMSVAITDGLEIHGLRAQPIVRRRNTAYPVLEQYRFVPNRDNAEVTLEELAILSTHIAQECRSILNVKTIEYVADNPNITEEELLSPYIVYALQNLPLIQPHATVVAENNRFKGESFPEEVIVDDPRRVQFDKTTLIVIGYDLLLEEKKISLTQTVNNLQKNSFVLTFEKSVGEKTFAYAKQFGLDVVLEKTIGKYKCLLLKTRKERNYETHVVHLDNNDFNWVEKVKAVLNKGRSNNDDVDTRLILVSQNEPETGLLGFVNCVRRETSDVTINAVMIQDKNAPKFSLEDPFYARQLEINLPINVFQNNTWGTYRHLPLPPPKPMLVPHGFVSQTVRGDLSSLKWTEGTLDPSNQEVINIVYSSLNFRDIMLATGRLSEQSLYICDDRMPCNIGFEFAGIGHDGKRYMGLQDSRGFANVCKFNKSLTWEVPDSWTLEEAATVPCAYYTSFYALHYVGKMVKGEKVLIHAGSGGVGQAAINIALRAGCEVFTTVGTPEKRKFIKETFPSIDDDHIGNSRDTSFEQLVMKQTNGRGVDLVLNSLAGDKLLASARCLTMGGRFLEIGKFDIISNSPLGMEIFLKQISFTGIMLDYILAFATDEIKEELSEIFLSGFSMDCIKPLSRTVFPKDEVENAFRYMAGGKHIGKVLIKICDENVGSRFQPISAYRRFYCVPTGSYIIFGGLGGLGLELAQFLYERNAMHLILISRSGITNGYQKRRIEFWESNGTKVHVIQGKDASNREDCEYILRFAESIAPVDGIFNLAAVLKDAACINQTVESFAAAVKPKALLTKRLDELSRKICRRLRHFVVFSSASCGRGTGGQSNYGFGNAVMERICEKRVAEGLPGLAIEWGAVGDVGLVANMQKSNKEINISGTLQQKVASCLQELEEFLLQSHPVVSSMVVAEKNRFRSGIKTPLETVMNIMGIKDLKTVSKDVTIAQLGLDSMLAVEIKQTLEQDFDIYLTEQDIRTLNWDKLTKLSEGTTKSETSETKKDLGEKVFPIAFLFKSITFNESNTSDCVQLSQHSENEQCHVFFIPGIEGFARMFSPLALKLDQPAVCIQLPANSEDQSVPSLGKHIVKQILERSKGLANICIVAYSYGTIVAIEAVRILESRGVLVNLILLDGTAHMIKTASKPYVQHDETTETKLLMDIVNSVNPALTLKMVSAVQKCTTWTEKMDAITSVLSAAIPISSIEYQKTIYAAVYRRVVAVGDYVIDGLPKLKSPMTLIKAAIPTVSDLELDWGLSKVTTGHINVIELEGNHLTILKNDKLAVMLNQMTTPQGKDLNSTFRKTADQRPVETATARQIS